MNKRTGLILAVVIVLTAAGAWFLERLHTPPSTSDMHNYFTLKQPGYEAVNSELLTRLQAGEALDLLANEDLGFTFVEASIEPETRIHYYTHYRGVGNNLFGTGLAFLESEPENIYDSVEAMHRDADDREGIVGYGRLTEQWFYFYWKKAVTADN